MTTVEHPARFEGVMRQARRELAREEEAAIDEAIRFPHTPEGQKLIARNAVRLIKWTLALGLIAFVLGLPALGAVFDVFGYLDALARGDAFMWQPSMDRAAFVGVLRLAMFAYPVFAALAVAGILVRGSEAQKKVGLWIGIVLGLVVLSGIVVFLLVNGH